MKISGMVDVGHKNRTQRTAKACVYVRLTNEIIHKIVKDSIPKGNVLEAAKIAGVMAAKKTSDIIPYCHNIELEQVGIVFEVQNEGILIKSVVKAKGKTGVEMEALSACSAAALTVFDMCKMFSDEIEIKDMFLLEKRGGKGGVYVRKN